MPEATPKQRFPSWPVGWYIVARSRDLAGAGGVISRSLAGAEVVIFRATSGELGATSAYCPHMGAHLRHGRVVGDKLQCPMHHWQIDASGNVFTADTRCGQIESWVVDERYGLVFVWLGETQPVPLPVPADPSRYRWRAGGPLTVATGWPTLMVSGFDMEHLEAVHHRRLMAEPMIATLADGRLQLRYVSKVIGGGLADRLMGWFGRHGIAVTMTCSGPIFVVETAIGSRRTAAILGLLPATVGAADGDVVEAYGSFGVSRGRWLAGLQLRLASWLFIEFLRKDFAIIEGIRLRTEVADPGVRAMSAYLAALPEVERE